MVPRPRSAAEADRSAQRPICRILPLKADEGQAVWMARLLDQSIPEIQFRVQRLRPDTEPQPESPGSQRGPASQGEPAARTTPTRVLQLAAESPADWIWVCGFEPVDLDRVRDLRASHEGSRILVTGRRITRALRQELLDAEVDLALEWPCPVAELRQLLAELS